MFNYFTHGWEGAQVCDKYVSLFETGRPNFTCFVCMLPLAMAQPSDFRFCWWRYVFISWGKWTRIKHDVIFRRSLQGGGNSWKSDN